MTFQELILSLHRFWADRGCVIHQPYDMKALVTKETGRSFPEDPLEQLRMGINAVFSSWYGARAVTYRRLYNIPDNWGTAVSVVAMVFGNMGNTSGTGVSFTRDPASGERKFFGEYLLNAQGEDVVAGIRTPQPVSALGKSLPQAYKALVDTYKKLEKHYRDMQLYSDATRDAFRSSHRGGIHVCFAVTMASTSRRQFTTADAALELEQPAGIDGRDAGHRSF